MQKTANHSGFKSKLIGVALTALLLVACSADEGPSTATSAAPTVVFTASPASVASGGTTTLTHSSTGATGCIASGSWNSDKGTSGNEVITVPTAPGSYAYTLTCKGSDGQTTANTQTVAVTGTTQAPPAPTVTFSADPTSVPAGGTTTLTHTTTGATACVASGSWSGSKGPNGSEVITVPTTPGNYAYTLTCTGSDGQTTANTVSITVTGAGSGTPGLITGGMPGTVVTDIDEGGTALTGNFVCTRSALAYGPTPVTKVTLNGLVGAEVTDLVTMLGASSAAQLVNSVTAKELVVDGNLDTFATFNQTVGALSPQIEAIDLYVGLNSTVPAGKFAVFGLSFPVALLELSLMQTVKVTTFTGTTAQETISYPFSGLDLLGAATVPGANLSRFLGVKATQSFDGVTIGLTPTLSANIANAMNVHELCTDGVFVTP